MPKKYAITDPDTLGKLCIQNGWFYEGSETQFEKLFIANENAATLDEIAIIIWLCSDSNVWPLRRITDFLEEYKYGVPA